ncbi:MAG: nicotinate-nucleotide adenylyltransferase [Thermodesulfobacteriota bacterium]
MAPGNSGSRKRCLGEGAKGRRPAYNPPPIPLPQSLIEGSGPRGQGSDNNGFSLLTPDSRPLTPLKRVGEGGVGGGPGTPTGWKACATGPWPLPPQKDSSKGGRGTCGPPAFPPPPNRLGLFGGTFNPIHYGHLRSGEEVAEALGLDQLWFVPAALPPHKASMEITPFAVRLEMTRLAVEEHPVLMVSDIEGQRPGKSYSIETLRLLHQKLGPNWELYFILGLDAILEISTWKDYRELFTLSHFVVLDRPGYDRRHLGKVLRREVHEGFKSLAGGAGFLHPSGYKVIFQATTLLDISATKIRGLVRQGQSIRYLLPERVRRYIMNNKLYLEGRK